MYKLTPPANTVLVKLNKKFYDTIQYESGVVLYKDTTYHPEESAMLEAEVYATPMSMIKRADYEGMRIDVRPGDKILVRYDVVFSYKNQPDRDTPVYKNVLLFRGDEYWKVDMQQIFGKKRGYDYEMLNGYVYCEPVQELLPDHQWLARPLHFQTRMRNDRMRVKYIGLSLEHLPELSVLPGDIIYVHTGLAQRYEINGKPFFIVKQSHILGKEENIVKY